MFHMHALTPRFTAPFRPATAYEVVANPTRRRLLELLRAHGPTDVLDLADELELSNLKLNHHLELLADLSLVRVAQRGERRVAKFRPVGWARLKKQWEEGTHRRVGLVVV